MIIILLIFSLRRNSIGSDFLYFIKVWALLQNHLEIVLTEKSLLNGVLTYQEMSLDTVQSFYGFLNSFALHKFNLALTKYSG